MNEHTTPTPDCPHCLAEEFRCEVCEWMAARKVSDGAVGPIGNTVRRAAALLGLEVLRQLGEVLGPCHCCGRPIVAGELGYRYGRDDLECANCAPTWREFREALAVHAAALNRYQLGAAMRAMTAHLEAGGQLGDRLPLEVLVAAGPAEGAA